MLKKRKYGFFPQTKKLHFTVITVTGVNRSGKTLLANLLGTMENVEFLDEPWLPMMLPVMQGLGLVAPDVAKDIFKSYTEEMFYDMILLRRANFKPYDMSSIWPMKSAKEMFDRLMNLRRRCDAEKYAMGRKTMLVFTLSGAHPFLGFIQDVFPRGKIIHVVRNGVNVATEVGSKKWFANEHLKGPSDSYMYFPFYSKNQDQRYFLPWWVQEGDEELFLDLNDFSKGLYFWWKTLELSAKEAEQIQADMPNCYREVRYEDLITNPEKLVTDLAEWLKGSFTPQTHALFTTIDKSVLKEKKKVAVEDIPNGQIKKANVWLEKFGYPALTKATL